MCKSRTTFWAMDTICGRNRPSPWRSNRPVPEVGQNGPVDPTQTSPKWSPGVDCADREGRETTLSENGPRKLAVWPFLAAFWAVPRASAEGVKKHKNPSWSFPLPKPYFGLLNRSRIEFGEKNAF